MRTVRAMVAPSMADHQKISAFSTIDACLGGDSWGGSAAKSQPGPPPDELMTFCLGITVDQGLVAIADTRLVAGNECLVGKKTASYQGPGFSFFVMTSGLRSLRDKALLYFEEAFARESNARERLYRVVNL